ncbi:hypothetical protein EHW99_0544 [Erwinia amylovora]|uniref:Uncharacterized protein n=2 Tax=Erwinia amylovora TaxID=552 RepID=A0A830ZY49_ERWAM|nr:hypothetical protein EaACW_3087 [Erwinia amylovora ACW56400]QJQ53251.1 hypothetical protein EHX00_0544 [Erwinia amylovora]CBA22949.1 hypothetical protein predicted by Glimmer/Critica [Erwinia amylovora CFBP1430]CCO79928.1 hypothetical protein BN432_3153 [Erwinia amylovora Ea356]CCO83733.1 hypothetical protein BN433_3179 [Erwinia amylovora Ea266]CCO87494.1 hypothetical protein BN434_3129 [Erwinia amylovora CFBP 2585]CCO91288.1 hypothetical protein BN435_3140 [Erwinia amylovora 01SFR-BO]CCO
MSLPAARMFNDVGNLNSGAVVALAQACQQD